MSTPTKTDYDIRLADPNNPAIDLLGGYAFSDTPVKPGDEKERERHRRYRRDDKIFISYVDDEAIAQVVTLPMSMNVRGVVMPMGGVSGVACMPVGRRSGHIRALLNHALNVMHEDGQPVSALYPFRESFYERFGFTGWQAPRWVTVSPANLGKLLKMPKQGKLRQRSMKDGYEDWNAFLLQQQAVIHGFSRQGEARREYPVGENSYWITTVHEDNAVTGAMIYKITDGVATMVVKSALWSTLDAQYQLLEFIARHVDQVERARICVAPGVDAALWLTDAKAVISTDAPEAWTAPMGRIVSIEALEGIRIGEGEISVQITDPQCPWNEGAWTLRSNNGTLDVTRGGTPQANLTIQALSALVFTGIDPALLRFRGWAEPDTTAIEALRALFPSIEPFIFEMF